MKFRITLKDPDVLIDAIREAVESQDVNESLREEMREQIHALCVKKWFKYSEYLTVEVDTAEATCTVVQNE